VSALIRSWLFTNDSLSVSDNKINGVWACEDNQTQNVELKGYSKYRYAIRSDYGATHTTVKSALAGLDQEFPGGEKGKFAGALKAAVLGGNVSQAVLDDKVFRVLLGMFTQGLFENTSVPRANYGRITANVTSKEHNAMARELASKGAVLLQNRRSVLPLDPSMVSTIAVIGAAASFEAGGPGEPGTSPNWPVTGGGRSSRGRVCH
jgi:beta-glucosidase